MVYMTPQVYIIFWGNWWVTGGSAEQSALTSFFAGAGLGDNWSKTVNQYYATLSTCKLTWCPVNVYPTVGQYGPLLLGGTPAAGSIVDLSTNVPSSPTELEISNEAALTFQVSQAARAASGSVIPLVVLPPGSVPQSDMSDHACGHHNWNLMDVLPSTSTLDYSPVPFAVTSEDQANPRSLYNVIAGCTPVGDSTAQGFTRILSHEWAEATTDPFPGRGPKTTSTRTTLDGKLTWTLAPAWQNAKDPNEIGDACEYSQYYFPLTLPTGTFLVQELWSNAKHACVKGST